MLESLSCVILVQSSIRLCIKLEYLKSLFQIGIRNVASNNTIRVNYRHSTLEMNLILENKDKLRFDIYRHYNYIDDGMIFGLKINIIINNNPELFNALNDSLSSLQEEGVTIDIVKPRETVEKRLKFDYLELDTQNKINDEIKRGQIEYHIDRLNELGVNTKNIEYGEYCTPEEYLEIVSRSLDYSGTGIMVTCSSRSNFYKFMFENKIITETWPERVY